MVSNGCLLVLYFGTFARNLSQTLFLGVIDDINKALGVEEHATFYLWSNLGLLAGLGFQQLVLLHFHRRFAIVISDTGLFACRLAQMMILAMGGSTNLYSFLSLVHGFLTLEPVIKAYLGDCCRGKPVQILSYREASCSAAFVCGPYLGSLLVSRGSIWWPAFVAASLLGLSVSLSLIFLEDPPTAKAPLKEDLEDQEPPRVWPFSFSVWVIIGINFLYTMGEETYIVFASDYLTNQFGVCTEHRGLIMSFGAAFIVVILCCGGVRFLESHLGLTLTLFAGICVYTLSVWGLFLAPTFWFVLLSLAVYHVGLPIVTTSTSSALAVASRSDQLNTVFLVDTALATVARLGILSLNTVATRYTPESNVFWVPGLFLLLALPLAYFVWWKPSYAWLAHPQSSA